MERHHGLSGSRTMKELADFYKGKTVLVTGHTGFKGAWLCQVLQEFGAKVVGYALEPQTKPSLYEILSLEKTICSVIGDVRDFERLLQVFKEYQPEIVFHLAAQPIVREGYKNPLFTYETNVMGTVNVLECIRNTESVESFVNVTTDKVYKNDEVKKGYVETDILDGFDPYSNSKSCSELVTHCYKDALLATSNVAISTARAGNVIGGGDFAKDRIIPDCVRAALEKDNIKVRNPYSIRPYQHVLEALGAYLLIAKSQTEDLLLSGYYNVGPNEEDCFETGKLVDLFVRYWKEGLKWENQYDGGPREAGFLMLNCDKVKSKLGWEPKWNLEKSLEATVAWTKCWNSGADILQFTKEQIYEYFGGQ